MRYSKLQYFFWLLSGSEISVLEQCENDYNRHANIGLMIMITSLFAAFTSFVAGYTFAPDNLLAVSLFSSAWALLIFAIDRSMVNSIKRDPNAAVQPFWSYFIPRLILAFILAFFMSIPLDHIIFEEKIERQMNENNQQDWLKRQVELSKGYDISRRDSNVTKLGKEVTALNDKLESGCPLPTYKQAEKDYNNCTPKIRPLQNTYNIKVKERKAHYKILQDQQNLPIPVLDQTWFQLNKECQNAFKLLSAQQNECATFKADAKRIDTDWQTSIQANIHQKDSLHTKQDSLLKADQNKVLDKSATYKEDIDSMKGFDTQFTTLFLMPNWGVQVLKWLIFLALFVIEILPTYLKLKTPVGQYDRKMQEREDIMKNDIELNIVSEIEIKEKSEVHRVQESIKLNTTLYDKIAKIELKLAEETLEEWENKARENKNKDVDNATNMNNY